MKFVFLSCGTRPFACFGDVKITTKYVITIGFILSLDPHVSASRHRQGSYIFV